MKYIIKYYQNINGVWEFTVKTTEDFELFINYLKSIERYMVLQALLRIHRPGRNQK